MINESAISIARQCLSSTLRTHTRIIVHCKSTKFNKVVWSRMVGFSGLAGFLSQYCKSVNYVSILQCWRESQSPFKRLCVIQDRKHHLVYYVTFIEL